jgi:hypothetical protein
MPTLMLSGVFLSLGVPSALAQTASTPGDFTPGYNLDTQTPSGTQPDTNNLKNQINDILHDGTLSEDEKKDAVNNLVNNSVGGGGFGTCAQQLDGLILGLDSAAVGSDIAGIIGEAAGAVGAISDFEIPGIIIQGVGAGLNLASVVTTGIQNGLPNCSAEFTGTVETWANFAAKQGISAFDGAITLGTPSQGYYDGITLGGGSLAGAGSGGNQASTGDVDAIAIGNGAYAENAGDTALGTGARATGGNATAVGYMSLAEGVSSIAIGDNAWSEGDRSVAVGPNAHAEGESSIALGDTATAGGANDIAMGTGTETSGGENNTAIGSSIKVSGGSNNTAVGAGHQIDGSHNTAIGDPIQIDGNDNFTAGNNDTVFGNDNIVVGNENDVGTNAAPVSQNIVIGDDNDGITTDNNNIVGDANTVGGGTGNNVLGDGTSVSGNETIAIGQRASTGADDALAIGSDSSAAGVSSIAVGQNATASGVTAIAIGGGTGGLQAQATQDFAIAIGNGASATAAGAAAYGSTTSALTMATGTNALALQGAVAGGTNSIAIGMGATATAASAVAYGQDSHAGATSSAAIGDNTTVAAAHVNSSAIGTGATTTTDNQMMFGTSTQTYTMPGITSGLSRSRQVGPLDVTTSDANGNLASDGGAVFTALSELQAGVAMSFALENPELQGNESFGVAANWGKFNDSQALGFAAMGVLTRDTFGGGERLAVSGGFAVSTAEKTYFGRNGGTQYGGRAGGQLTW